MYETQLDEFIDSCESYKIYDSDIIIAEEGFFKTIGGAIMKAIRWIKEKIKQFWQWITRRKKKEVAVTKEEEKAIHETIQNINKLKTTIQKKDEVKKREDDAYIRDIDNQDNPQARKGDAPRKAPINFLKKNQKYVMLCEEENDIIMDLQNFIVEAKKFESAIKPGANYQDYRAASIQKSENIVSIDVKILKSIIDSINEIIDKCDEREEKTIAYLRKLVQFVQNIIDNNDRTNKDIDFADNVTGQRILQNGATIAFQSHKDKEGKFKASTNMRCFITWNLANKKQVDDYKFITETMDLFNNPRNGLSYNEYMSRRRRLFSIIGMKDDFAISAMHYTVPTYAQAKTSWFMIEKGPIVRVRPGQWLYHCSPVDGIRELRPSFRTNESINARINYPMGRVYVSISAPTQSYYGPWNRFGQYIYRFKADGYVCHGDNEFNLRSTVYIETDRPIPVEQITDEELEQELSKRQ